MTVDLSLRNDTGNINQPPVTSMASSIIYPCTTHNVNIPGKKISHLNMRYSIPIVSFYLLMALED